MLLQLFKDLYRNRKARFGMTILFVLFLLVYSSPFWSQDPLAIGAMPHLAPSQNFWFGTNGQGQDVLAQCFRGAVLSLTTAFLVGAAVTMIGAFIGTLSAYLGGWFDQGMVLLINLFLVIPGLPLAIILAAYLPPGPMTIGFVLIITGWAWNARVLRSQALSIKQRDFVQASLVAGEPLWRIVIFEILPNMISLVLSTFIGSTIYAIGAQVGLEFLGLGDISQVSWGTILYWANNDSALLTGSWWMFVPVGIAIALVGFSLSLINFGVDEITNPRLRDEDEFYTMLKDKTAYLNSELTPVVRS